ncbi:chitooligosaccharide synthase NodC, partial [Rhizobium ruizarguesonis]
ALCTLSNSDWLSRGSVSTAPTVGQQGATKMPGRATSEIAYSVE